MYIKVTVCGVSGEIPIECHWWFIDKTQRKNIITTTGVTSNTVPWRSVRWMVTLIVPNINRFLPPSTFLTTRGVRYFNRMEFLSIPQVPLWRFSGGRRSRSFRDGQHCLQIWILLRYSGEEWRRKLVGPSRRTWRSFGMPARWPSMTSPMTSSTSSMTLPNRMATVLQAKGTHTRY